MKKLFLIISLVSITISAQETEKDSIGTQEVNIIKPYTPTIKDAFKIKKNPVQGKDTIQQKKEVSYEIHSVPVASTFTPSKGKAKGVAKKKKEHIYQNFVSLGFGTYTTPMLEAFIHTSTTRDNDLGINLNYLSSDGDVKDAVLDSDFMDAEINLFYKQQSRDFDWKINGGYQFQKYNWYGLRNPDTYTQIQLDDIDPKHTYGNINLGGNIKFYESFFDQATVNLDLFSNNYNSNEFHLTIMPKILIPVVDELIETDFRLEYISGKMERSFTTNNEIKYGFFNLGISPTFKIIRDDLTLNLGARLVYSSDLENNINNRFFIYPNVSGSYEIIIDVLTAYAEVTGDLQQHSYRNFISQNSFLSPTINVGRTHKQYDAELGIKGKLASNISFNTNISYKNENAKALFMLNSAPIIITENYQNNNSFNVVYDDVSTLSVFGELTLDISKELQIGGNGRFNTYNNDIFEEAWNLPNLEFGFFANYTTKKWYANANLFMLGERKDYFIDNAVGPWNTGEEIINIKSFVDLNFKFGYQFKKRLTFFAQVNNALGKAYEEYTNFRVQGIQFLGGLKYKFDVN